MTAQNRSRHGNQPITQQQKQTLIAVYRQTGNMSQAIREANIRSPRTAYLWWHRYCEAGEVGLQPRSHARHTQERLPDEVAARICELRRQEPEWGRRQIATALVQRYGQAVSPASVEAVLRREGLWKPNSQPETSTPQPTDSPDWLRDGKIDYDRLLATVQDGIRLSVHSDARAAAKLLYQHVWHPLHTDLSLWHHLLATAERGLGSWLLVSRLHLGHSLMNTGHWPQAAYILRETISWMQEHRDEPHNRSWETTSHVISLRRDDVWLGCYQHLGLVLGKKQVKTGLGYLQTAADSVYRSYHPVAPSDKSMLSDLERDLVYLKLRLRHLPEAEIRQHLYRAQRAAEDASSPGVHAFTDFAWAKLYDRLAREAGVREQGAYRQRRDQMEQAIHQALELMECEPNDRPMRLTLCFVDAAQLAHAHGMPIEGQQVQRAAGYCMTYGYGGQAGQLLAIPGIEAWLPDSTRRDLTALSHSM